MTERPDVLAVAQLFKRMASEILLENKQKLMWDDAMTLANLKLKTSNCPNLRRVTAQPIRLLAYLITYGLEPGRLTFGKGYCHPDSVNGRIVNYIDTVNKSASNIANWVTVEPSNLTAEISATSNCYQPRKTTMKTKAQIAIETSPKVTITFIYGKIAVDMSVSELVDTAGRLESEIAGIASSVAKTAYGKAKLQDLRATQLVVETLLDKYQAEKQDFSV